MFRKCLAFIFVFAAFSLKAEAASIAIQLVQHDGISENVRNSSYIIENAFFDYFFSLGFIVTNSQAVAFVETSKDKTAERDALSEARSGGCDYFVMIVTDYDLTDSLSPEAASIDNIKCAEWKLVDVKKDCVIKTGRKNSPEKAAENVQTGLNDFVFSIADDILKVIYGSK